MHRMRRATSLLALHAPHIPWPHRIHYCEEENVRHGEQGDGRLARDELRVHDNALLAEAAGGAPVLPVFCLDPRVFDASAKSDLGSSQKTGSRRAKFVLESLEDLRGSLDLGSGLVVRRGSPRQVLADVCEEIGDGVTSFPRGRLREEQKDEAAVSEIAPLTKVWDGTLYHRDDLAYIPFKDQFTGWRHARKSHTPVRADRARPWTCRRCRRLLASTTPFPPWMTWLRRVRRYEGDFFDPRGGEAAALERLQRYVWDEDRLRPTSTRATVPAPRPFDERRARRCRSRRHRRHSTQWRRRHDVGADASSPQA